MFLSNSFKFFLLFGFLILEMTACGGSQTAANNEVSLVVDTRSRFPFLTKTPDVFSTDILLTAGTVTRRIFFARDRDKSRTDYDAGTENEYSILRTDKVYLLSVPKKVYAEREGSENVSAANGALDELTTTLLNRSDHIEFEDIGIENELKKFRARVDGEAASETIIYVDEQFGLPVKQEFFSIRGNERTLTFSVVFENFKLSADPVFLEIPKGLQKVSADEFYRSIR